MGLGYFSGFSIRLIEKSGADDFFSTSGKTLLEMQSETAFTGKDPVCILADPFLVSKDGEIFLFYECQKKRYGKGDLRMRKTRDLVHWSDEKVVLEENFHLSFPNVFEHEGNTYMIPETGADGSIRLYKADDESLEKWSLERTIVNDGQLWADSDIFFKDGYCYLFSSTYSRKEPKAHLFVSESLTDAEFREHPLSPYCSSPASARNAGRIFSYEGRLFRPVQDCSEGYGKQISIMEITDISPESYREVLYRKHILPEEDFYKRGGHQFCPLFACGRTIVATDAKVRNFNFRENVNGYTHHLFKKH